MEHPLFPKIDGLLLTAAHPACYAGGEWNAIVRTPDRATLRLALVGTLPYEEIMSDGLFLSLYEVLNREHGVWAERVCVPGADLVALLAEAELPLFTLESRTPLGELHGLIVYLPCYTALLNFIGIARAAGLAPEAAARRETDPLVVFTGPPTLGPAPLAPFADLILVGEPEASAGAMAEAWRTGLLAGASREELIRELARGVAGAYAPSLYRSIGKGRLEPLAAGLPWPIRAARADGLWGPERPVVANVRLAEEALPVALDRGVPSLARRWQLTAEVPPLRERDLDAVVAQARAVFHATGVEELRLCGGEDWEPGRAADLAQALRRAFQGLRMSFTAPDLPVAAQARLGVRRLQIGPPEVSPALARRLGRPWSPERVLQALEEGLAAGAQSVTIRIPLGVGGEGEEDLRSMGQLLRGIARLGRRRGSRVPMENRLTLFLPPPQSPFAADPIPALPELEARAAAVRSAAGRLRPGRLREPCWAVRLAEARLARCGADAAPVLTAAAAQGLRLESLQAARGEREWSELAARLEQAAAAPLHVEAAPEV